MLVSLPIKLDIFVAPCHGPILGILPAPNAVHYIEDPAGYFKVHWEPPTLVSDEFDSQNVSIDSRITHFIIYITVNESTTVYNASGTSFDFENDNLSCSLSFQVAAENPAGVGERSPLHTIHCELSLLGP